MFFVEIILFALCIFVKPVCLLSHFHIPLGQIFNSHALKQNSSQSMTHTAQHDQPPLLRSSHKNLVTKLKAKANEYFFIVC